MPHVVLDGPMTPEEIWLGFKQLHFTEGGMQLKVRECYLREDKSEVLVAALTVERGFTKRFFLRIAGKDNRLTLDIEPLGSPEKSEGVKRLLGVCAWYLMEVDPRLTVANTDIADYVGGPRTA